MHQRLIEVTGNLHDAREALRDGYDPLKLYKLRVATRRMRSILKHIGTKDARRLRKTWNGFASKTSEARDWDVFLTCAELLLDEASFERFKTLNKPRIDASRETVAAMLQSEPWQSHLREWSRFLETAEDAPAETANAAALALVLERAENRLSRALEEDTDRRWHKFRIAVKEVRYVAEANPQLPESALVVAACRSLQTLLGDWHDTVVQLDLLDGLAEHPVHAELEILILQRKHRFLTQILESLAGQHLFTAIRPGRA